MSRHSIDEPIEIDAATSILEKDRIVSRTIARTRQDGVSGIVDMIGDPGVQTAARRSVWGISRT